MGPIMIMIVGTALVLLLILWARANAFLALIAGAFAVSLLAPGESSEKIGRVAEAFGDVAGGIGIVIALAAIIGKALLDSGAAERIVRSMIAALGVKRAPTALMGSGFVLAIPVFFDTVFYLMVPIARALWRSQRKNYVLYLTAIVAGAAVAHSVIPPTPGPLFVADAFGVDLGLMILMGVLVAIPMAIAGLGFCYYLNRRFDITMRPYADEDMDEADWQDVPDPTKPLPPLLLALSPVIVPVLLIAANTIAGAIAASAGEGSALAGLVSFTQIVGNPNAALLVSTIIALYMLARYRSRSLAELATNTETALMSGGVIILITAAGGAFGAMLRGAGIDQPIQAALADAGSGSGMLVLLAAFATASMIKVAQGSGTVAMITTASMFAAMGFSSATLGFNPVYLALVIGAGSLVGDWMNNSGFWIFAKMGGLTTRETLSTWTPLTALLGITGLISTLLFSAIVPLT